MILNRRIFIPLAQPAQQPHSEKDCLTVAVHVLIDPASVFLVMKLKSNGKPMVEQVRHSLLT